MVKQEPAENGEVDRILRRFVALAEESNWFTAAADLLRLIGQEAPPVDDRDWCDERLIGQLRFHLTLGEYSRAVEVLFASTPERVAAAESGLDSPVDSLPLSLDVIDQLKNQRLLTVAQVVRNRSAVDGHIYAAAIAEALDTPLNRVLSLRDANTFEKERGVLTLGELAQMRPRDIEALPRIGAASKEAIARAIRRLGLELRGEMATWVPPLKHRSSETDSVNDD